MTASGGNVDAMEREVVLTRIFDAPREVVFDSWTKAESLQQWWGPAHFTNPVCEVDLRVGGCWRIVMRGPDGKEYPGYGVYREIVPPSRLVFTNIAVDSAGQPLLEGLTIVLFDEQKGKTKLTVRTHMKGLVPFAPKMLAGMEQGWSSSLDGLAEQLLGGRALVISRIFDAPRELVWEAWTDPRQIVQWWGPNGFTTTIEQMDVRPGGLWTYVMHGPDETNYPGQSVFREVIKPERIVFSHAGGRKGDPQAEFESTWTFAEEGARSLVTIQMLFATPQQRDLICTTYGAMEGGYQTLERLGRLLANLPSLTLG